MGQGDRQSVSGCDWPAHHIARKSRAACPQPQVLHQIVGPLALSQDSRRPANQRRAETTKDLVQPQRGLCRVGRKLCCSGRRNIVGHQVHGSLQHRGAQPPLFQKGEAPPFSAHEIVGPT